MAYDVDSMLWGFKTIDGRKVPFVPPQHGKDNSFVPTTHDNPLPTGNYVQNSSGIWIPQKGSDDGAAHMQLTGRNIEEVFFFDEESIRSDSVFNSPEIDLKRFKSMTFYIINSLDQDIDVFPQLHGNTTYVYDGQEFATTFDKKVTITGGTSRRFLIDGCFPEILDKPIDGLRFVIQTAGAPTSGTLTVGGIGVIN